MIPPVLITELKDDNRLRERSGSMSSIHDGETEEMEQQTERLVSRGDKMALIVERILFDAPFAATSRLREAWRGVLQSAAFQELSLEGFHWFKTHVVSPRDRGEIVIVDRADTAKPFGKMHEIAKDEHFSAMAANYVWLFWHSPVKRKDAMFDHFYEAMAYSILLTLSAAQPRRRAALSEDYALKKHIIDLCAEWTKGIRPSTLPDDHWIVRAFDSRRNPALKPTFDVLSPRSFQSAAIADEPTDPANNTTPSGATLVKAIPTRRIRRETLVRASYTLHHSPFFRHYLEQSAVKPVASTRAKVGLTVVASRVQHFFANHVPEEEVAVTQRKIERALRVATKPLPASYVLSNSGVARRSAMEEHARLRIESKAAAKEFIRARRKIDTLVEAEEKNILDSGNLREYAMKLAKGKMQGRLLAATVMTAT